MLPSLVCASSDEAVTSSSFELPVGRLQHEAIAAYARRRDRAVGGLRLNGAAQIGER